MKRFFSLIAVFLITGIVVADSQVLDKPGDWVRASMFNDGVGKLSGKGYRFLETSAMMPIVSGTQYTVSAEVRGESGKVEICSINLALYDAQKKLISTYSVYSVKNTETALVAEAPAGSDTVKIKDGANWKTSGYIAFDVKSDFSDLPNRNTMEIKSVEKNEIILKKPLEKTWPADTAVRQHKWGQLWLGHDAAVKSPGGEWTKISGVINGIVSKGVVKSGQFWPGAAFFRVIIHYRGADEQSAVEVKNVTVNAVTPNQSIFL